MAPCPRCGVTGTRISGAKGQTGGHQLVPPEPERIITPAAQVERRREARSLLFCRGSGGRCEKQMADPSKTLAAEI